MKALILMGVGIFFIVSVFWSVKRAAKGRNGCVCDGGCTGCDCKGHKTKNI